VTIGGGSTHAHQAASKIAQLLGEVIIHHTPVTAEIIESAKARFREQLLEELEDHTATITRPIISSLMNTGAVPEEVAVLLRSISDPEHQVSALAGQFLLYGVGFAVASAVMAPFLQDVQNALWADNTTKPIDPANLVVMAVRGLDPDTTSVTPVPDNIKAIAAMSGYSPQYFQAMVDAAGSPPAPQDLFQMFRRSIIDRSGVVQGLREGDTKDDWIDRFIELAYTTPTPIDMVRAAVQNQLTYDEANAIAITLGLEPPGYVANNPDWFRILFNIAGRPPGTQEVGRMANRGIVPFDGLGPDVTSFAQAVSESDVKTKWTAALAAIQAAYPTAGEATEFYKEGAITEAQLDAYLKGNGVPAELAAAYKFVATTQQVAQDRALAKGDILTAYYDGILTDEQATELLGDVGYVGKIAEYLIDITDQRRIIRAVNMAVRRVGSLYVGFKMSAADAKSSLEALDISEAQATNLLAIWEIERKPETRLPSVRELSRAVRFGGLGFDDAVNRAMNLGYTKFDATLIIAGESEQHPPEGYPPDDDTGVNV